MPCEFCGCPLTSLAGSMSVVREGDCRCGDWFDDTNRRRIGWLRERWIEAEARRRAAARVFDAAWAALRQAEGQDGLNDATAERRATYAALPEREATSAAATAARDALLDALLDALSPAADAAPETK